MYKSHRCSLVQHRMWLRYLGFENVFCFIGFGNAFHDYSVQPSDHRLIALFSSTFARRHGEEAPLSSRRHNTTLSACASSSPQPATTRTSGCNDSRWHTNTLIRLACHPTWPWKLCHNNRCHRAASAICGSLELINERFEVEMDGSGRWLRGKGIDEMAVLILTSEVEGKALERLKCLPTWWCRRTRRLVLSLAFIVWFSNINWLYQLNRFSNV